VADRDTFTVVECFRDADCDTSAQFCDTSTNRCVSRVPNGNRVPTISGHDPVLDGMCTAAVGDATCVSRVCEESDDLCGYRNGPDGGPCTVASGAVVCRSGVCSPGDMRCGYRDGEGPCTPETGPRVCRSGLCGPDGLCRPTTGCDRDADCDTATQYCDTPSRTCVPRVPNGMAVPTSPGHDPELAGECTEPAGEAACLSRVCEARDDLCGYLEGTPCADDRQCRSDICAPSGLCAVCDETTPCPTGSICDVPTGTCLPEGSDAGPVDGGMGGRPGGLAGGALCAVRPGSRPAPGVVWVALLAGLALVIGRRRQG
jgi:hypothetical protein